MHTGDPSAATHGEGENRQCVHTVACQKKCTLVEHDAEAVVSFTTGDEEVLPFDMVKCDNPVMCDKCILRNNKDQSKDSVAL